MTICFLSDDYQETWAAKTEDFLLLTIHKLPGSFAQNSTKEREMPLYCWAGQIKEGAQRACLVACAGTRPVCTPWANSEGCPRM